VIVGLLVLISALDEDASAQIVTIPLLLIGLSPAAFPVPQHSELRSVQVDQVHLLILLEAGSFAFR
jgi:hypothetical protein